MSRLESFWDVGSPYTYLAISQRDTLLPLRVAVVADSSGRGEATCRALFDAYGGRGLDVSQEAVLREVMATDGLDPDATIAAASTQEIQDRLRASTDEAVEWGAFGAPAMFIGDERYWGCHRLFLVVARLKELAGGEAT